MTEGHIIFKVALVAKMPSQSEGIFATAIALFLLELQKQRKTDTLLLREPYRISRLPRSEPFIIENTEIL